MDGKYDALEATDSGTAARMAVHATAQPKFRGDAPQHGNDEGRSSGRNPRRS